MAKLTTEQKVERLKAWALANYEKGADTFVECYGTVDYMMMLENLGGSLPRALSTMKKTAAVLRERQADAAYHRRMGA